MLLNHSHFILSQLDGFSHNRYLEIYLIWLLGYARSNGYCPPNGQTGLTLETPCNL